MKPQSNPEVSVPHAARPGDRPNDRLNHRLDGPDGAPVLVLGPSLGTTLEVWEPQLAALTEHWRVLRYDLPGHGDSPVPAGPALDMDALAAQVLEVLDDLGVERFVAGGVSLGGAIAATLALTVPGRVTGLILCCTSARFGVPAMWHDRIAGVKAEGMGPLAEGAPERWFSAGCAERRPEIVEPIQQMLRDTDPDAYMACCEALAGYDIRDRLKEITAPAVVIAGAEDPASPLEDARVLASGIAGAELVVVENASHLAGVERPGPVTDAMLRHLASLAGTDAEEHV